MMKNKVRAFQERFNDAVTECERFCVMSRGREFQEESVHRLAALEEEAASLKAEVIEAKEEDAANAMLSFEQMIRALRSELLMWIALKDDDPNSAWDHLICAQDAARTAVQAHPVATHLETGYLSRLYMIEKILFPQQVFISTGFVVRRSECSICGKEYGECGHVKGRPYMGQMCVRMITETEPFHDVSMVDDPADKHCRIASVSDGDGFRDYMTWRRVT